MGKEEVAKSVNQNNIKYIYIFGVKMIKVYVFTLSCKA
jgi:hypothetical protein